MGKLCRFGSPHDSVEFHANPAFYVCAYYYLAVVWIRPIFEHSEQTYQSNNVVARGRTRDLFILKEIEFFNGCMRNKGGGSGHRRRRLRAAPGIERGTRTGRAKISLLPLIKA